MSAVLNRFLVGLGLVLIAYNLYLGLFLHKISIGILDVEFTPYGPEVSTPWDPPASDGSAGGGYSTPRDSSFIPVPYTPSENANVPWRQLPCTDDAEYILNGWPACQ